MGAIAQFTSHSKDTNVTKTEDSNQDFSSTSASLPPSSR